MITRRGATSEVSRFTFTKTFWNALKTDWPADVLTKAAYVQEIKRRRKGGKTEQRKKEENETERMPRNGDCIERHRLNDHFTF